MPTTIEKDRLDVNRKVITLVTFGVISALLLILIVNLSINTSSGVRAYVAGEGLWAKAQKGAVIHLSSYILTGDEEEFNNFKSALRVNIGDKIARQEMLKDDYNYQTVYEGFIAGQNHPEDIPHMVNVFRRFQWTPQVQEAINVWTEADKKMEKLIMFADSIHLAMQNQEVSLEKKSDWIQELKLLDQELTVLENRFSAAMGNIARLISTILHWSVITFGLILISLGLWLAYRFLKSTKTWMQTLSESEERFKNVLSNSKDVLYKMNLYTQEYEFVSPALKDMLGYEPEEFMEGGVNFILSKMHPDDKEKMLKVIDKYEEVNDDTFLPFVEFRLKDSSGHWKWVSNNRTLVGDEKGKPTAIVGNVRDISKRKEQEEQISKSLKEKEVLLQEIHHRVKNNLAIISSLLELQKEGVSEEVKKLLSSSQSRIKSIAKVHEKLYESSTLSDIQLDHYINEISQEIEKAYKSKEKDIALQLDLASMSVDINDAISIGLILNELINNAFKHAFQDLKEGIVKITLQKEENSMKLVIANNGKRLAEDFDITKSDSLGMTLIHVLIKKINGSLTIESGDWTEFIIRFNLSE